ncbi:MAG: hypothetical protein SFX19_08920 [Alphaproteobacteria bacterium]|nr:hypothetical protein [Alphaproteobacteria bacterium]
MKASHRPEYSLEEMETKYNTITLLYDLADELLATVESPFVKDAEAQLKIVEPVISEISEATDILTEEFIHITESRGGHPIIANKTRVENAMRKVFNALNEYRTDVRASGRRVAGGLRNIADPVISKIQRHIEEVVVIFFEFLNISLSAIMHKQQLEAVRIRDPRIALMMHQHALQQQ